MRSGRQRLAIVLRTREHHVDVKPLNRRLNLVPTECISLVRNTDVKFRLPFNIRKHTGVYGASSFLVLEFELNFASTSFSTVSIAGRGRVLSLFGRCRPPSTHQPCPTNFEPKRLVFFSCMIAPGDVVVHLTLLVLALQGPLTSWALRAEDGARVVVDTNLKCEFPVTPPIPYTVAVGMPIQVIREVNEAGNTSYVGYPAFAPNSPCKIPAASTAVFHKAEPNGLALTILDHILARVDVTFEELLPLKIIY